LRIFLGKEKIKGDNVDPTLLCAPRSICVAQNKFLVVADTGSHTIRIFNIESLKLKHIVGDGSPGNKDGAPNQAKFNLPSGIATNHKEIIVADTGNHRIARIKLTDFTVETIRGSSELGPIPDDKSPLYFPQGVAISPQGTIAIADTGNSKILISRDTKQWIELKTIKMSCPKSLSFSLDENNLYIVDSDHKSSKILNCNINDQSFSVEAGDVGGFEDGIDTAKFNKPSTIITDPTTGKLIISDTKNSAIRTVSHQCVSTLYKSPQSESTFQPVGLAYHTSGVLVSDPSTHVIYLVVPKITVKVEYQAPPTAPELKVQTDITIPLSTVEDIKNTIARQLNKDIGKIRLDVMGDDQKYKELTSVSMLQNNALLRVVPEGQLSSSVEIYRKQF